MLFDSLFLPTLLAEQHIYQVILLWLYSRLYLFKINMLFLND